MNYKELQEKDEKEFPYIVDYVGDFDFDEHADARPFQFANWEDALKVQVFFNSTCSGHKAMKRKPGILARTPCHDTMEAANEHHLSRISRHP